MGEERRNILRAGLGALPCVFAVLVLGAVALSLLRLLGADHPDIGYFRSNSHDGLALRAGQGLFNDPARGYTGLLYTPGLPILLAGLDLLKVWQGWAPLVTMLSVLVLAGYAGRLALGGAPRTPLVVAGSVGVAGMAVWLVTPLVGDALSGAGPDHLCWALAFGGLLLVPRVAAGSARATVGAALLLTAAFWVKQPAAVAGAVSVGWLAWQALRGRAAWPSVLLFALVFGGLNVLLLVIANVVTDGQQWALNVELGQKHARVYGKRRLLEDAVRGLGPAALVAAALAAVTRLAGRREASLPSLLVCFAVCGLPFAAIFRAKQGGEDNQYLGVAWALALLIATWWGTARADGRSATAAGLIGAAVLAVAVLGTVGGSGRLTFDGLAVRWADTTAPLRAYARQHSVYHPVYSDVSYARDGRVWQDVPNLGDLLAAGEQPGELVRALLDRRFDAVVPFAVAMGGPTKRAIRDEYASAYGKREAGWFWKADQVIAARYVPATGAGVPAGIAVRRPGPERDRWQRDCFGDFDVAGATWTGRAGGGFWCHTPGSSRLALRGTPAPDSEVVTDGPVTATGTLAVTPGRRAPRFSVRQPGVVAIDATRVAPDRWRVTTVDRSLVPRAVTLRGRTLSVPLPDPAGRSGRLSLLGPREGGVVYDLAGLRLRG